MAENKSEIEYLRILKRIIIENVKPEYEHIAEAYRGEKLSTDDAYEELLMVGHNNLRNVLGNLSSDRTGTGTYKIFGDTMRFDLQQGFPLLTTKRVFTRGIFEELFWFINGETNIRPLVQKGVGIWNEWPYQKYQATKEYESNPISIEEFIQRIKDDEEFAKKYGDLGPVYGAQWRNFGGHDPFKSAVQALLTTDEEFRKDFNSMCSKYNLPDIGSQGVDQLSEVIYKLKHNPNDRRMLVIAYNPQEVKFQALPACHAFFQFNVKNGELSCTMYQRSCDMFLGVPFNIASYAALTHMIAQVTGLKAKEYIHVLGDAHIYADHVEQVQLQLSREPYAMPTLWLDPHVGNINGFNINKVKVKEYRYHPAITGKVSV